MFVCGLAFATLYVTDVHGMGPTVEACTSRALPDYKSAILLPPSHKSKKMLPRKRDTSQSHAKGPFSGPALTIMSFNVEGISAAKEQLIADLRQRLQCAVVCIQETHRGPDAIRHSIPGMDLAIERPHSQYGSAIFVTSGTIVNTTSLTDINNIEILRVDLNGISVTSVYKPPGERFSIHQPLTAVGDQQQVIIGDFNSHSSTWGYATTNTDGEMVEDRAENQRLSLIYDPKLPSYFNSGRWRRNPDIIFATNRIAGCCNKIVMEPIPRSQHRPIGVQVNAAITVQTVPFRRRFNLKKANWEQYAYQLDAAVENIPATAECYDQFVNALRKVARKNIPRGCRRNYVPVLTPESIELIKEYREKYEDDPFADSTITLGEELMSAISEERRKAWQTLIESTDMTHNSKKAWSTVRKLCDDPCKPKQHCNTTANQVAHQLLLNGRVPNRQPKVRLDRQRYPDDPGFTRAFTAAELDIGIRVLKNGKSPGLDDIQTELIKQFGPKARDWLLRFFNNCTETKKIPKIWRQAKVVALLKPGKDPSVAKSFRPISLLCHTYELFERLILNRIAEHVDAKLIPEQAGFRPGKSCTSQLLNLTEHIEGGYEKRLITGAVFVDLSAAYDTVNHRRLLSKVLEMTGDVHLTDLIRTMLESRRFFVVLNGKKSRWRRQRNGLPQGSVLAPMLFNIYTNDQPTHADTLSFIYADDLCIASQGSVTHVCPEHYDYLQRHEPTACEPFKDTGVCFAPKEPRSQTRTECSVERYQTLKHNNTSVSGHPP